MSLQFGSLIGVIAILGVAEIYRAVYLYQNRDFYVYIDKDIKNFDIYTFYDELEDKSGTTGYIYISPSYNYQITTDENGTIKDFEFLIIVTRTDDYYFYYSEYQESKNRIKFISSYHSAAYIKEGFMDDALVIYLSLFDNINFTQNAKYYSFGGGIIKDKLIYYRFEFGYYEREIPLVYYEYMIVNETGEIAALNRNSYQGLYLRFGVSPVMYINDQGNLVKHGVGYFIIPEGA